LCFLDKRKLRKQGMPNPFHKPESMYLDSNLLALELGWPNLRNDAKQQRPPLGEPAAEIFLEDLTACRLPEKLRKHEGVDASSGPISAVPAANCKDSALL
jgi:hypothetical protein